MRSPLLRPSLVLGVLILSGALSYAASPRWSVGDGSAPSATRHFLTGHLGDTLVNRLTTTTDTVLFSLPRPPGLPSRVLLARCGTSRKFSRDWIGNTVVAADTDIITVTGSAAECANPPVIPRDTSRAGWPACGSTGSAAGDSAIAAFVRPCVVDSALSPSLKTGAPCDWRIVRDTTIACIARP